jgi:hypothetical protein
MQLRAAKFSSTDSLFFRTHSVRLPRSKHLDRHPASSCNSWFQPIICFRDAFYVYLTTLSTRNIITESKKIAWPLKMEPVCCPETSVNNYKCTQGNFPEGRKYSLKSYNWQKMDEHFVSVADDQTASRSQMTLRSGCKWLRMSSNIRAVHSVHKTSDSKFSIFKPPTPPPS